MKTLHYLAYGSNLHPLRLMERAPSARVVGVVAMPGRCLKFHKRSNTDRSAKCDLVALPGDAESFAVLYELSAAHKPLLDAIEGLGHGYREARVGIQLHGVSYRPFLYVAETSHIAPSLRPFHWYKEMVIAGARHHGLPEYYVAALEAVESVEDPDPQRTDLHVALLERMARY
jgi:hypothetical protein